MLNCNPLKPEAFDRPSTLCDDALLQWSALELAGTQGKENSPSLQHCLVISWPPAAGFCSGATVLGAPVPV